MIKNKNDGKIYIGQTIRELEIRWKDHLKKNSNCRYLSSAINKHHIDNFEFKLICITFDEYLDEIETKYIEKYNSLVPNGYNLRNGGNGGKHNEETKKKISESLKNRTDIIHSKPQLGKAHTEETKNKISDKLKGKKLSKETKDKMVQNKIRKKVLQIDNEGNILNIFDGCKEAAEYISTSTSYINMCCNGIRKTAMGYKWKYQK